MDNAKVKQDGRMFIVNGQVVQEKKKKLTLGSLFPKMEK